MANSFFFSELWLKDNSPITFNVDYQDLRPFIMPAQDQLIKVRIGKELYERLMDSITNLDYNTNEQELISLIRPAAAYFTVYLAIPFLQSKIRNKGLVKGTDQYIQTISKQDMLDLREQCLQMSDYYMARVNEYLCLYSSNFPEYADPDPLNRKTYGPSYDMGGFTPIKGNCGYGLGSDVDLILKTINYKFYR